MAGLVTTKSLVSNAEMQSPPFALPKAYYVASPLARVASPVGNHGAHPLPQPRDPVKEGDKEETTCQKRENLLFFKLLPFIPFGPTFLNIVPLENMGHKEDVRHGIYPAACPTGCSHPSP